MGKPEFNRSWSDSRGFADPDAAIAAVLLRPTFADVLHCALTHGPRTLRGRQQVLAAQGYLTGTLATEVERMLRNVEIGFANADRAA